MTAKQYMNRARFINGEINDKREQKRSIYDSLTKITQSYESDGAQSTKEPHKFDRLAEINDKIDEQIKELQNAYNEIIETISKVQDGKQRRVLTLYYTVIDNRTKKPLTWEQVAVEMHFSWKHTKRIHAKALQSVDEIIKSGDTI